ncbi:MAG: hypothetical protein C0448_10825 [Sphingobacteriaceae bacterium]|nr:hypothetical protein [Sphingobacteriaceae bacterium]
MYTKTTKQKNNWLMALALFTIVFSGGLKAQLSGTKTIGVDYPTLAAAVTDINALGVNGPLIINIPAGYTETAPLGGYVLTATGTLANTITFQKNGAGANPLLTAYTGTATPTSAGQDGVFRLVGSDYVTIDGIDVTDPNTVNPATMEFGYALYKATADDGCQNNTIKNCVITLSRINNASGSGPIVEGSVGIYMLNSTAAAATTALTPTLATGSNSNNKFYSNTIQNCNYGMALIGFAATTPFTLADTGNDIGGVSSATGNTIINYGGGAAANPAAAIRTLAQYNINVSFNTINNNNGSGINHATTLRGIYLNTATSANAAITNNTVTLHGGGTTSQLSAIENASGSTAATNTVVISNNLVTNSTYTTATSGAFYGIFNSASPAFVNISNNIFNGLNYSNSAIGGSGSVYPIYNTGATTTLSISSNTITNCALTGTTGATFGAIYLTSGTNQIITNNSINSNTISGTGTGGTIYGIRAAGTTVNISNNTVFNLLNTKTTGTSATYGIFDGSSPSNETYNGNTVYNLSHAGSAVVAGMYFSTTTGTRTLSNNNVYTLSSAGGTVYGLYNSSSSPSIFKNKVYDLSSSGTAGNVSGIYIISGTTVNIFNNTIGDLRTPISNNTNAINGINIAGGTTVNAYYNSVYLNAASTGTLFGSSAITASTGSTLDLRNNIFVNNSTPTGTAIAVAYRRSSTTLTTYANTSNSNLFYAGTPSAATAIFYDGTTVQQTLANFKTLVGPSRDAASVTENPTFASTTGSNANFLHFNPATSTLAESGGVNISGITDDFDANIRQGNGGYTGTGSSPDIGADEFEGVSLNLVINGLSISPTGNLCTAAPRVVTATVTPGASPLTSVELSYSFNGTGFLPVAMSGGSFTTTSTWTATIPAAFPSNANVTWTVTATDGTNTKVSFGTSYKDEPTTGVTATALSSINPVCAGSTTDLSLILSSTNPAPTSYCSATISNTTEDDIGQVTFAGINNPATRPTPQQSNAAANATYTDFTGIAPAVVNAGQSYPITIYHFHGTTDVSANFCNVYLDFNQNGSFADAGETFTLTKTGVFLSDFTGNITIPTSASMGLTRMRVILKEGAISSPCGSVGSWGEVEDYLVSVAVTPTANISWTDGVGVIGTTNPITATITANTTFTVTSDLGGCPVTAAVTVTNVPLPSAPIVSNSSQCGIGVPTASVVGGANYNWYATPTSTAVLQTGTASNFTTSIGATTTWYVTSVNGACESTPRAAVTTTVSIPDPVTANTSASNLCTGGANTVTLTAVQTGTNNAYNFTWNASSTTGSGMPSSVTGTVAVITPTVIGNYTYSVTATDGVCTTVSTVTVGLNNPPSISATANPTVVCSGSPVNLNAQSINASVATTTIGSGATTSSSSGSPFYYGWGGAKVQYIYTAAELTAQGLLAGNITSIGLNITSVGVPYEGFALSIGATTQSVFPTANTINSITQVYTGTGTNNSYTPVLGVNNFVFSTPFNWDGVSNVVISICWSNATTGGTSSAVRWDTYTGVNKGMYIYSDNQTPSTVCSATTTIPASGGSSTTIGRPQTYFTGLVGVNVSSAMNFIWNPGSINTNTAIVNPVNTGTVASSQVYTVTVTNTTTACSNTATASVLVNPLPSNPIVTDATQCGVGVPTASVSGGTSYNWYATPTSTTVLQSGATANYTTSISNTTTWYVTSFNGTCESSPRVAVTQSVTIPDAVSASSSATKLCVGSANTITLTATQTGTNSNAYTFTWNASPATGSGMPTSLTGSVVSITPSTVGNYVYNLSASDGTCIAISSVSVSLNNVPSVSTTATPSVICSGENVGINAQSIDIASGTATVGLTGTNSTTGTPYRQGNGATSDFKTQYLYTAAELNAAGIYAGNITDIRFNVTAAGSGMMDNFEIKMGATSTTSLGTAYDLPPSTVYGPYSYSVTLGQNIHTFDTPFNWDGTSNVIIEICHDAVNPAGVSSTMNVQTISNRVVYSYTAGACGFASGTSTSTRPRIAFSGQIGTNVTSSMVWTWNPGAIPSNAATVTPVNTGSTAATSVYTVSVNNPATTCSNTGTVGVLVNEIPTTPAVTSATQCGVGVPTSSVSGGTSYNWYATPTSTTVLQSGTSTNFTTSISNTTSWYVTSVSTASCQSPRAQVTTTVNIPDAVTASVSSASICPNTTVALIATNTGTTNTYSYTWTAVPATGSGITGSVSGSSVSISPSVSGNYVYSLTAVDGACTAVNTVSLNVFQTIDTPTAIATPSVLCSGNSATLSLNSSANVTVGTVTTTTQSGSGLSPYAQNWESQRTQYLFKASELTSFGLSAGNITSMAFNVTAANATLPFTNYTLKMYHTTSTDLVSAFATNSSPIVGVFGPVNLPAPAVGVNTHNFATPFTWDGTSNVIVDICFENDPLGTGTFWTGNAIVSANTVTGYTSVRGYYDDDAALCNTSNLGTLVTSTARPRITFMGNSMPGVTTIDWTTGVTSVGTGSVVSITPTTTETYTATITDNNSCVILSTPVTVTVNTTPTVSAVASNTAVCAGSTATLTASGATTYSWTSGGTASTENVNPTALTVYTVTGSANGCSSTATVSVDALAVPSMTVAASNASICSGNSTTLTASGATNYTWTSGGTTSTEVVTPATTTTYTVTGEATGCSSTATVSIDVTATPTVVAAASSATICTGSSATLTASGATNYTWTSGGTASTESVTPTALTIYTVTGETSGCSNTATVSVDVNTIIPTVTVSASSASVCSGSSATLTAGGATNYTWTSGGTTSTEVVTPTTLTVYTVTGETNSCSNTATVSLAVNQTPTVSAVASQTLLCDDGSTGSSILTASSNGTSYLWSDGATTMTTVVTPSVTSVYTITATGNGCSADAYVTVTVSNCNGIKDLASDEISIFPNPTNGNVTISIPASIEGNVTVEVYDAIGKLTIKENITNNMSNVNLSKLEDGMYMFKIINNNKTIKIGKIVKQ